VRSRAHRRAVRAGLAVLAVATVAWVLFAGPLLAVRTVQVDGAGSLTAARVRQAAGVAEGTPLLRVDVDAVRGRVALLPQVASVQVSRGWPATLVITLAERVPVAVVQAGDARWLVDRDGVPFERLSGGPPRGVVPLDVAHPGPADPATRAALAALVALPAPVREGVARAAATTDQDVRLSLSDGTTVLWGDAADSPRKASVLAALLGQMKAGTLHAAQTVDVSAPGAVVLR
jgi:cell division protein FtsQ